MVLDAFKPPALAQEMSATTVYSEKVEQPMKCLKTKNQHQAKLIANSPNSPTNPMLFDPNVSEQSQGNVQNMHPKTG